MSRLRRAAKQRPPSGDERAAEPMSRVRVSACNKATPPHGLHWHAALEQPMELCASSPARGQLLCPPAGGITFPPLGV
jgi:hypothetical protein